MTMRMIRISCCQGLCQSSGCFRPFILKTQYNTENIICAKNIQQGGTLGRPYSRWNFSDVYGMMIKTQGEMGQDKETNTSEE